MLIEKKTITAATRKVVKINCKSFMILFIYFAFKISDSGLVNTRNNPAKKTIIND